MIIIFNKALKINFLIKLIKKFWAQINITNFLYFQIIVLNLMVTFNIYYTNMIKL
jgi:hypothetical protein